MSQTDRSTARTAFAKRPLTSIFESSTLAYLIGAGVGVFLAAALIFGVTVAFR